VAELSGRDPVTTLLRGVLLLVLLSACGTPGARGRCGWFGLG
jgi:hypothetical protein